MNYNTRCCCRQPDIEGDKCTEGYENKKKSET